MAGCRESERRLDTRLATEVGSLQFKRDQAAPHPREAPAGDKGEGVEPAPRTGLPGRPWLSPEWNARIRVAERNMTELLDDPLLPLEIKKELADAAMAVRGFERDILRADETLKRSGNKPLSDAEWLELSDLLEWAEHKHPAIQDEWHGVLCRLLDNNALSASNAEALRRRLDDARRHFHSADMPWEKVVRRIEIELPYRPRRQVLVYSHIVPGAALGTHFDKGYRWEDNAGLHHPSRYTHLPRLEQSVLIDADGERLFAGLRHRIVPGGRLTGALLAGMPYPEREALMHKLCDASVLRPLFCRDFPEHQHGPRLRQVCAAIPNDERLANRFARNMSDKALEIFGREAIVAALAGDPDKFQRALHEEGAALRLFYISMGSVEDEDLMTAFRSRRTVAVGTETVRSSNGTRKELEIHAEARNFYLASDDEPDAGRIIDRCNRNDAVSLLGPRNTWELHGDAGRKIDEMRGIAAMMRSASKTPLAWQHTQMVWKKGWDHADVRRIRQKLIEIELGTERLERNASALETAGKQLKLLWRAVGRWPHGADAQTHAAARLALIAHLMGEVPVLVCADDTDLTERLDPEIKFLATIAAKSHGDVPSINRNPERWDSVRCHFTPQ